MLPKRFFKSVHLQALCPRLLYGTVRQQQESRDNLRLSTTRILPRIHLLLAAFYLTRCLFHWVYLIKPGLIGLRYLPIRGLVLELERAPNLFNLNQLDDHWLFGCVSCTLLFITVVYYHHHFSRIGEEAWLFWRQLLVENVQQFRTSPCGLKILGQTAAILAEENHCRKAYPRVAGQLWRLFRHLWLIEEHRAERARAFLFSGREDRSRKKRTATFANFPTKMRLQVVLCWALVQALCYLAIVAISITFLGILIGLWVQWKAMLLSQGSQGSNWSNWPRTVTTFVDGLCSHYLLSFVLVPAGFIQLEQSLLQIGPICGGFRLLATRLRRLLNRKSLTSSRWTQSLANLHRTHSAMLIELVLRRNRLHDHLLLTFLTLTTPTNLYLFASVYFNRLGHSRVDTVILLGIFAIQLFGYAIYFGPPLLLGSAVVVARRLFPPILLTSQNQSPFSLRWKMGSNTFELLCDHGQIARRLHNSALEQITSKTIFEMTLFYCVCLTYAFKIVSNANSSCSGKVM